MYGGINFKSSKEVNLQTCHSHDKCFLPSSCLSVHPSVHMYQPGSRWMGFRLSKQLGISSGTLLEKSFFLPRVCLCDFALILPAWHCVWNFTSITLLRVTQFFELHVMNSHLIVEVSQCPGVRNENVSMNYWCIAAVEICGYTHVNLVPEHRTVQVETVVWVSWKVEGRSHQSSLFGRECTMCHLFFI